MDITELEDLLEEVMPGKFKILTNKNKRVIIYTNLIKTDDDELKDPDELKDYDEDYEEEYDDDMESYDELDLEDE